MKSAPPSNKRKLVADESDDGINVLPSSLVLHKVGVGENKTVKRVKTEVKYTIWSE